MKLKELFETGLVKDSDRVTLKKNIGHCCEYKRGRWFQDNILEELNSEVSLFNWTKGSDGNVWSIDLAKS